LPKKIVLKKENGGMALFVLTIWYVPFVKLFGGINFIHGKILRVYLIEIKKNPEKYARREICCHVHHENEGL